MVEITRLEELALGCLLISDLLDNHRALVIGLEPVTETRLFEAARACDLGDWREARVALLSHALLGRSLPLLLLGLAVSTHGVRLPSLVGVSHGLELDSRIAERADDHVDAVVVAGQRTAVVVCAGVVRAEDLLATVALEGQEVLLVALLEGTVLTNVSEFHNLILMKPYQPLKTDSLAALALDWTSWTG